jgi:methionyl-tRNA formyltransferase
LGLPVLTPPSVNSEEGLAALRAVAPDVIVVVAFGQILAPGVLALPPLGCVNVHPSLLPKYRGAAPIQWAIANGERATGVTTMYMTRRMDAGDIIFQRETPIGGSETGGALHDRLAEVGAELLDETLAAIAGGTAPRVPQNEADVTFAPKLTKEDGRIQWTRRAGEIVCRIRAFHPWPGSFCGVARERSGEGADRSEILKILKGREVEGLAGASDHAPGAIVAFDPEGPVVAAGDTEKTSRAVCLVEVQPEGKKAMSGSAYARGHGLRVGDMLE